MIQQGYIEKLMMTQFKWFHKLFQDQFNNIIEIEEKKHQVEPKDVISQKKVRNND
jgi:hypothetical protein